MIPEKYVRFDWAAKTLLRDKSNFGVLEGLISVLLNEKVEIEEILESESNRTEARKKLQYMMMSKEEKVRYPRHVDLMTSQRGAMRYYHEEKLDEGLKKSLEKGLKKGRVEGKAEGLAEMKQKNDVYADVSEENNPLPDKFVITYIENEKVPELDYQLSQIEGIIKVNNRLELATTIENLKSGVMIVFIWFLAILGIVSVFIINIF